MERKPKSKSKKERVTKSKGRGGLKKAEVDITRKVNGKKTGSSIPSIDCISICHTIRSVLQPYLKKT